MDKSSIQVESGNMPLRTSSNLHIVHIPQQPRIYRGNGEIFSMHGEWGEVGTVIPPDNLLAQSNEH
jgi:hypothetical protein